MTFNWNKGQFGIIRDSEMNSKVSFLSRQASRPILLPDIIGRSSKDQKFGKWSSRWDGPFPISKVLAGKAHIPREASPVNIEKDSR